MNTLSYLLECMSLHNEFFNRLLFSYFLLSFRLLCRLTPPICLNFLGLIHMDSHVITELTLETSYTQIMGHLDVLSLLSHGFNIYFPMGILIIGSLTYFKVGSRVLNVVGFHQFLVEDEGTGELVTEGQQLIARGYF